MDATTIERALTAVGELLAADGQSISIVVVGGATLSVLGLVPRVTDDVEIIALATHTTTDGLVLTKAKPLPAQLGAAARTVARDFGLPADWLNAEVGAQFDAGLPPTLREDLTWRSYAGLHVGYVGRIALVTLKLFAAADHSPGSVHTQDLLALRPSPAELEAAAVWVMEQDGSSAFHAMIREVIAYVIRIDA